jgi:hypothetical protein
LWTNLKRKYSGRIRGSPFLSLFLFLFIGQFLPSPTTDYWPIRKELKKKKKRKVTGRKSFRVPRIYTYIYTFHAFPWLPIRRNATHSGWEGRCGRIRQMLASQGE